MIVSDIATRVRDIFGDEAAVVFADASIIRWINDGLRDIAEKNDDLLEIVSTANTVANQQEYSLPTGLRQLRSIRHKDIHLQGRALRDFDEFVGAWSDPTLSGGTGTPTTYTMWASKIILYPIPDLSESNALKIYYTRFPTAVDDLSDTIDLPDSHLNPLISYVLGQAYEKEQDREGAASQTNAYSISLQGLKSDQKWPNFEQYPRITTLPEDI